MSLKALWGLSVALVLAPAWALADPAPPAAQAEASWSPYDSHGAPARRSDLPDSAFAFPIQRKEPMTDRAHVRAAIARFGQVKGVSDEDRALAFANIQKAARYYGVALNARDWTQMGSASHAGRATADRKAQTHREEPGSGAAPSSFH
jgi:hypothetical protein